LKVLLVDNYDSFTFNLFHYLERLGALVDVVRSDKINLESVSHYDKIILSPGPGLPKDFPGMMKLIDHYFDLKPILGVCLGMQALCSSNGGELYNLNQVYHGVQEEIKVDNNDTLYKGLGEKLNVALYHSWAIRGVGNQWLETSFSVNNILMSVKHKKFPVYGIQYHPESILTPDGLKILSNFLDI